MAKFEGLAADVDVLVMGMLANNVYIVGDQQATIVVDPSCKAELIVGELRGRKLDAIFITHYHADHTGAAGKLRQLTGATVYASAIDSEIIESPAMETRPNAASALPLQDACPVDVKLQDGDTIQLGGMTWEFMLTPGHSKGSGCFYLPANEEGGRPVLLSGDTLFNGTTGRTDFFGGSQQEMFESLVKLSALPDDTAVLPGHNGFTSIANEKQTTMRRWGVL